MWETLKTVSLDPHLVENLKSKQTKKPYNAPFPNSLVVRTQACDLIITRHGSQQGLDVEGSDRRQV